MTDKTDQQTVRTTVIVSPVNGMNKADWMRWGQNLLKFVAPTLGVFFGLIATGVDPNKAVLVAILGLYQALSDLFNKYKNATIRPADGAEIPKE